MVAAVFPVPHIQVRELVSHSCTELIDHPSLRFQRCPSLSSRLPFTHCTGSNSQAQQVRRPGHPSTIREKLTSEN